jgi:hypothetical protein
MRGGDAATANSPAGVVVESLTKAGLTLGQRAEPRERSDPWRQITAAAGAGRFTA